MGKVDRLLNRVEPFAALFWAVGILTCQRLTQPAGPASLHRMSLYGHTVPKEINISQYNMKTWYYGEYFMEYYVLLYISCYAFLTVHTVVGSILSKDALPSLFLYLCRYSILFRVQILYKFFRLCTYCRDLYNYQIFQKNRYIIYLWIRMTHCRGWYRGYYPEMGPTLLYRSLSESNVGRGLELQRNSWYIRVSKTFLTDFAKKLLKHDVVMNIPNLQSFRETNCRVSSIGWKCARITPLVHYPRKKVNFPDGRKRLSRSQVPLSTLYT